MPAKINLIGRTFGRGFVFAEAPPCIRPDGQTRGKSWVRCVCGTEFIAFNENLKRGHTTSCGCYRDERRIESHTIHGHAKKGANTRTYKSWCNMIDRCERPENQAYHRYGGRGIKVCQEWRQSYESFLAYNGECPPRMQIDRWPNKNGDYEPGNTRWATPKQQNRNRNSNKILTVRGITGCLAELCEHFNVPYRRTSLRLFKKWSVEEAFFVPQATNQFTRKPITEYQEQRLGL